MAYQYNLKPTNSSTNTSSMDAATCLGMLFNFRDRLHLAHLKTTSYASHMALGSLYEDLLDKIDQLVETAQVDKLLDITIPQSSSKDSSETVAQELLDYVRNTRQIFPYTFQQNILDEIEAMTSSTIYKLKFLK